MKTLLALLMVVALLTSARSEDEPKSENDAKTVRGPDGKFVTVAQKKDAPPKKEDAAKKEDKPAKPDEVIDASEVEKLKGLDGKEVKVRGKVHEVFVPASGGLAVLNLGKDFKSCFKVAIYKSSFEKFGGLDEIKKMFAGKEITVEGKVTLYQKLPQIVANVPSQIKVDK